MFTLPITYVAKCHMHAHVRPPESQLLLSVAYSTVIHRVITGLLMIVLPFSL